MVGALPGKLARRSPWALTSRSGSAGILTSGRAPRTRAVAAWLRRGLAVAGGLGAAAGVPVEPLAGCSPGVVRTLAAISVSALIFAALVDGAPDPSRSFLARADAGLRRHWTVFVPPLAFLLLPSRLAPARAIIAAASFVLAAWSTRDAPAPLTSAPSRPLWPAALLVTAGCICVAYVLVGRTVAWNTDNDPAYYFGLARHIVTAHRFDEPIVWHFLIKPPAVAHPPFDYWAMLPALALVPFFFLFGPTHHVAGVVMGLVSGLSIVGFAYLVSVAAPFRSRLIQLIALLLFAFAPALMRFRFDVETVTFVHLWTIAALVCLARGRWEAAVVLSFLIFLSRSESVVLTAILWTAAGLAAARSADARRLRRVLAAALACAAAYVAGCFALFHDARAPRHAPGPPPHRLRLALPVERGLAVDVDAGEAPDTRVPRGTRRGRVLDAAADRVLCELPGLAGAAADSRLPAVTTIRQEPRGGSLDFPRRLRWAKPSSVNA